MNESGHHRLRAQITRRQRHSDVVDVDGSVLGPVGFRGEGVTSGDHDSLLVSRRIRVRIDRHRIRIGQVQRGQSEGHGVGHAAGDRHIPNLSLIGGQRADQSRSTAGDIKDGEFVGGADGQSIVVAGDDQRRTFHCECARAEVVARDRNRRDDRVRSEGHRTDE